jgi:hypothetical protein
MKNIAIAIALLLLGVGVYAGFQIGAAYLANIELTSDLKDLSSLTGVRIGFVDPRTPDQIRDRVIAKAAEDGIHLDPEQVNVDRTGEGKDGSIYLSTAYNARVNLFGYSWTIRFTAASPRT